MLGSDIRRRWWACSKQGCQVGAAHILLRADVCKELSKAGLRIQPRCEEEGTRAIVLIAQFRIRTARLQEARHHLEGILRQGLLCARRPRREDEDIEARGKYLRDERWVYSWLSRRDMARQAGHPGTDS